MNIELMDMHNTQILATLFNEAIDKFDAIIKLDHVYTISGGKVKVSNKKFTSIKNDFCLMLDHLSTIVEV